MSAFITTGQAAKMTGHSPRTVCKWFDKGLVSGYVVPGGQDRRINKRSLYRLAERVGMPITDLPRKKCKKRATPRLPK